MLQDNDRGGGLERLCALLSERGRGLQIVNYLTRGCWGFHLPGDGTKIAWVAILPVLDVRGGAGIGMREEPPS